MSPAATPAGYPLGRRVHVLAHRTAASASEPATRRTWRSMAHRSVSPWTTSPPVACHAVIPPSRMCSVSLPAAAQLLVGLGGPSAGSGRPARRGGQHRPGRGRVRRACRVGRCRSRGCGRFRIRRRCGRQGSEWSGSSVRSWRKVLASMTSVAGRLVVVMMPPEALWWFAGHRTPLEMYVHLASTATYTPWGIVMS